MLAAHPSLGVETAQDLIKYAQANPGVGFATSGVGSNQHVLLEWFAKQAGIKLDHVPYRGAGQAINDLVDADNGGFVSAPTDPTARRYGTLYDTAQPGNGNEGHLYGTTLSEEDKQKLLAFLKTL